MHFSSSFCIFIFLVAASSPSYKNSSNQYISIVPSIIIILPEKLKSTDTYLVQAKLLLAILKGKQMHDMPLPYYLHEHPHIFFLSASQIFKYPLVKLYFLSLRFSVGIRLNSGYRLKFYRKHFLL